MIRRLFYLSVGAAIGVYVVRRVNALTDALTPQSVGGQLRGWWHDVREAAAEREAELRSALGVDKDER